MIDAFLSPFKMNLKKLYKQKIEECIFKSFNDVWSILIHDKITSNLIHPFFKKSDLLNYRITGIFSIGDERPSWDLPAIYFVECTKEIVKKINSEFKSNKYSSIKVFSLNEPNGLDPMIQCTVINLEIDIIEERVFKCSCENISALSNIMNSKISVSYIPSSRKSAEYIEKRLKNPFEFKSNASLLVLDRTVDLYTPLMYFFTFRTILKEVGDVDCNDEYFKEIKNTHLGDVNKSLQYSVLKIQESVKKLDNKNVDVDALDTLVLEAPKNIELKKNIEKYSGYLQKCIQKLETIKEIAESQQNLVLEKDSNGNKVCISLDSFLTSIVSPGLPIEDRVALLFLLKTKGITLTESEKSLLKSRGFSESDLNLVFNRKNQILRNKEPKYVYNISRYEPVISDIIESFVTNTGTFENIGDVPERISSLRKTTMLSSEKQPRETLVVYIKNGLTIEEIRLAYSLSEKLGIEIIIGSDKVLNRKEFVEEYRTNKELQEAVNIKKT